MAAQLGADQSAWCAGAGAEWDARRRGLKFVVNETPFRYRQAALSVAALQTKLTFFAQNIISAGKGIKNVSCKKLLLKWALRRASRRTRAATDRVLREWGKPDFQESAGKHDCRLNRVYELRRKFDALKYK